MSEDELPKVEFMGMIQPGSNLGDMLDSFRDNIAALSEQHPDRKIMQASLCILWDNGGFSEDTMIPQKPENMKLMADTLATAAERWYKRWEATQDPDDYGKDDQYVS